MEHKHTWIKTGRMLECACGKIRKTTPVKITTYRLKPWQMDILEKKKLTFVQCVNNMFEEMETPVE